MSNKGLIYILINPSFQDYVKIGYTENLEQRLKQLNNREATPFEFKVYATYETGSELTDARLYKFIDKLNPNLRVIEKKEGKDKKREFFAMSPEEAYSLLECIAMLSGTMDKLQKVNDEIVEKEVEKQVCNLKTKSVKKATLKFSDYNIPIGSTLEYVNDKRIKVQVVDEKTISYKGLKTSMSSLATKLTKSPNEVQGTLYFCYNGKTLWEIRKELGK